MFVRCHIAKSFAYLDEASYITQKYIFSPF
jgi:hypothetical protein